MHAKVPNKLKQKKTQRKQQKRVSNYLESTKCCSENEKVYFRSRFTRFQHQILQSEKNFQSRAYTSYGNERK